MTALIGLGEVVGAMALAGLALWWFVVRDRRRDRAVRRFNMHFILWAYVLLVPGLLFVVKANIAWHAKAAAVACWPALSNLLARWSALEKTVR